MKDGQNKYNYADKKFIVTSSPHLNVGDTVQKIMLRVLISLTPAAIAGCIFFGAHAFYLMLVCITACIAFEWAAQKLMKRKTSVSDLSAAVTGLLLAFTLPPKFPLWMAVIGSFTAIVIVKQCFGGIGQNFANPAATARIVLLVSFPVQMTSWVKAIDGIASATPLAQMQSGNLQPEGGVLQSLLLGPEAGSIGEVSRLLLLAGALYLLLSKVITVTIPLTYILTVTIFSFAAGADPVLHIMTGGLILGAFFMATDYTTCPMTFAGRAIYGCGCGIFTMLIRLYSNMPEGVSFAILLMNILTPLIEKAVYPKPFGAHKLKAGGDLK